jgi:hypothetical protein
MDESDDAWTNPHGVTKVELDFRGFEVKTIRIVVA